MGGRTRLLSAAFFPLATISRSPSSMREVSVRPSAAALRLARSSRPLGSRTVVRWFICQDISGGRLYVKERLVCLAQGDRPTIAHRLAHQTIAATVHNRL